MSSPSTHPVPKAILYTWPSSVWSTVPRLCLVEKGYSDNEYIVKQVDLCTIPTLVVPTLETTGEDVATRYRSLRDTISICDFLDQARSAGTHNTISDKPAPALAPATIEGKTTSDSIIALVHLPPVDPNFLNMAARDLDELKEKSKGSPGKTLSARRAALHEHTAECKRLANSGGSFESKLVSFLEEKTAANEALWAVYNGQAGKEKENAFLEASKKAWTVDLPEVLSKVDSAIKGPFTLGDQVSLADLHVISWLTRLISIAKGGPESAGIEALEKQLGSYTIGPKLKAFWTAWLSRESYRKVLVPAFTSFEKTPTA